MDLNGVAAIVSGGASGLGEATVRDLAAHGCKVVVADLNEERGKSIADSVGGVFARTDVADEASVSEAVAASCAGIGWASRTVGRDGKPHDLGSYRKVIDVNLIGTFNVMRIAAAAMAKTEPADADGQRGVVINTASIAGIEGLTGQISYSSAKGFIIGMTVPMARYLASIG